MTKDLRATFTSFYSGKKRERKKKLSDQVPEAIAFRNEDLEMEIYEK